MKSYNKKLQELAKRFKAILERVFEYLLILKFSVPEDVEAVHTDNNTVAYPLK